MDQIVIDGGLPLHGKISISGSKNAALPLMAASLLTKDTVILSNIPQLADVVTMSHLLINHGTRLSVDGVNLDNNKIGRSILLNSEKVDNFSAPYDIVRKMRASVLVLGPLLARFGKARVSLPGGCAIGTRPINMHLDALKSLGAEIEIDDGYIEATCKDRLQGAEIFFDKISVGATENAMMAASLADGKSVIYNAAREPEIINLADFLNAMGARVKGAGSDKIEIDGVSELKGAYFEVMSDRIEAGTYAVAAMITGGELLLENISPDSISNITDKLIQSGAKVTKYHNSVLIKGSSKISPVDISTGVFPSFPTDMQAQFMSLMSIANGTSNISENIFENRFMHVSELTRMGADISVSGNNAIVRGVNDLKGAQVMATDLRASVSLILAGLVAKGRTSISRIYHLDRGYEKIEDKLRMCGAKITRIFAD